MDLSSIFQSISQKFIIRRDVDFNDLDVHMTLQTPSTDEELKITEACSEFDGGAYIDQLKTHSVAMCIRKINGVGFDNDEVEYPGSDGKLQKKSRYLYVLDLVKQWPSSVREVLFDVYTNMHQELDEKIRTSAKFERFMVTTPPETASVEDDKFKEVKEATGG